MRDRMKSGGDRRAVTGHWFLAAICVTVVAVACSSDTTHADLAQGCLVNSDCNDPLVCAFRRCHVACETTRDCTAPLRCVASDRPFHVCQLAEERACSYNSECPQSQVCGVDGQCRDQCQGDSDCIAEQVCVSGSCADLNELRDGGLPFVVKDGGPSTGQSCSYNSQCPANLVCRSGICQLECLTSQDCSDGRQCVDNRCQVPLCPEVDAGANVVCAFSSDCPAPLVCRTGTCTCECRQSGDCPSGYDCIGNRCTPSSIDSIGPEGGLVMSADHRLTLEVPANALAVRVRITIDVAEAWPAGAIGPVFEVRPTGTQFMSPATFVYRYQAGDIAPFAPTDIRLGVATASSWTPLATTIGTGTATAQVTHLSTYGLIAASGGGNDASVSADGSRGAGGAAGIGAGGTAGAPAGSGNGGLPLFDAGTSAR